MSIISFETHNNDAERDGRIFLFGNLKEGRESYLEVGNGSSSSMVEDGDRFSIFPKITFSCMILK